MQLRQFTKQIMWSKICRWQRLVFSTVTRTPSNEDGVGFLPKIPHFSHTPAPYDGPSASDLSKRRKQYLPTFVGTYYTHPLNLVEGKMQYVYDENGRRYLDAFGGIATVLCGHCHPDVVEAIVNQTRLLQHTTVLYLNHAVVDFAEALAAKMPGELKVVFFTNSGTEANELALMMARLYTGYHDVISIRNGYHGNATSTMGATAQFFHKFNVVQTGIHHVLNPDPYRGVFDFDGEKYANDVQDVINYGTCGHVAGFVAEAIQGVGGVIELAPGYLPAVYSIIKKAGGLFIADEVQSGFGRTGSHFWGFEAHGILPDIVTMAKGIGNGAPIGAVVTTPEIAKVLKYAYYFSTFGGNPVSTAAGLAVLNSLLIAAGLRPTPAQATAVSWPLSPTIAVPTPNAVATLPLNANPSPTIAVPTPNDVTTLPLNANPLPFSQSPAEIKASLLPGPSTQVSIPMHSETPNTIEPMDHQSNDLDQEMKPILFSQAVEEVPEPVQAPYTFEPKPVNPLFD